MKKLVFLLLFFQLLFSCNSKKNPEKGDLKVDVSIEKTFSDYVEYWSDGNFDKIVKEIYNVPFVLYTQDSTTVMNTNEEVKDFFTLDSLPN